jgi:hypothetical protein
MGKLITYTCDECHVNTYQIRNDQDQIPPGWYTKVTHMGRKVDYICHNCYEKMCNPIMDF